MIKTLLAIIFSFTATFCSAQTKILSYQDLQYIIQSNPAAVAIFMQQKGFYPQPAFSNDEARFFILYADADYTDISIKPSTKHGFIHLSTTHFPQVEEIQKALTTYPSKNSRGAKIYRVKDKAVSNVSLKEDEPKDKANKIYTIELEN